MVRKSCCISKENRFFAVKPLSAAGTEQQPQHSPRGDAQEMEEAEEPRTTIQTCANRKYLSRTDHPRTASLRNEVSGTLPKMLMTSGSPSRNCTSSAFADDVELSGLIGEVAIKATSQVGDNLQLPHAYATARYECTTDPGQDRCIVAGGGANIGQLVQRNPRGCESSRSKHQCGELLLQKCSKNLLEAYHELMRNHLMCLQALNVVRHLGTQLDGADARGHQHLPLHAKAVTCGNLCFISVIYPGRRLRECDCHAV